MVYFASEALKLSSIGDVKSAHRCTMQFWLPVPNGQDLDMDGGPRNEILMSVTRLLQESVLQDPEAVK